MLDFHWRHLSPLNFFFVQPKLKIKRHNLPHIQSPLWSFNLFKTVIHFRYGQHVKTFTDYDARDLLRLSKDDIIQVNIIHLSEESNQICHIQMIGLVDGLRLYNDLHMKPVAPRLTIYLAQKGESLFHPVLLQDVTVAELVRNIAEILEVTWRILEILLHHLFTVLSQVPVGLFHKVVVTGPNKISIKLTDEYLR